MRIKHLPVLILGLCIFLALIVSGRLYQHYQFSASIASSPMTIVRRTGVVKRRSIAKAAWQRLGQGESLDDGDRLATGVNSFAEVALAWGPRLRLGEKTLVHVSILTDGQGRQVAHLNLLRGFLEAKPRSGNEDSRVMIKAGRDSFELAAELRLLREPGQLVQSLRGKGPLPLLVKEERPKYVDPVVVNVLSRRP